MIQRLGGTTYGDDIGRRTGGWKGLLGAHERAMIETLVSKLRVVNLVEEPRSCNWR